MTKSVILTIPEIQKNVAGVLRPTFSGMGLVEKNDSLLYGFHGRSSSKAECLAAAYSRAEDPRDFYVINLKIYAKDEFDDVLDLLNKPLTTAGLEKVPFLNAKRLAISCNEYLGELWRAWAVDVYGLGKVENARVDWDLAVSFMPAFPLVADRLFNVFPQLQCAMLPMYFRNEQGLAKLTWVGMFPKVKAGEFVSEAEVSMRDIQVDLNFD